MKDKLLSKRTILVISALVILFVGVLSVGFAAFNTEMNIAGIVGKVRPTTDVRFTNITLVDTSGNPEVRSAEFTTNKLMFDFSFPDDVSSLTYEVEITVFGSEAMVLKDLVVVDGTSPHFAPEGIEYDSKLCDEDGLCNLGVKVSFMITFDYDIGDFNFSMEADFGEIHTITYEGVSGDYPTEAVDGRGLYINFPEEYNCLELLMDGVVVDNSIYVYESGVFSMDSVEGDLIFKLSKRSYGDVNGDGKITSSDTLLVSRHISGSLLTGDNLIYADVNGDGNVNEIDMSLIRKICVGAYAAPGDQPLTDYIHYGDIDEDNEITSTDDTLLSEYLGGTSTLTDKQLQNADINDDGVVNNVDLTLIRKVYYGYDTTHCVADAMTEYVLYGDVNEDGLVNTTDLAMWKTQYATLSSGGTIESEQSEKNMDVNGDGTIDESDQTALSNSLVGSASGVLPYEPCSA